MATQKSSIPMERPIAGMTDCSAVLPAAATSIAAYRSRKCDVVSAEVPTPREPAICDAAAPDEPERRAFSGLVSATRQRCEQQQSDDVGDLDHRVHGRPGGVLVRIADGVAGHRGLVRLGTLATVIAVLDIFLGIVPGAAPAGHRNGDEQAGDDHAEQQSADGGETIL